MRRLIAVGLSLGLLATGLLAWQVVADVTPPQAVDLEVPRGASTGTIGRMLAAHGVINSELVFRLCARLSGRAGTLQSGFYRFDKSASILDVLERLHAGDVILFRVTVPEGLRSDEIIFLLARETSTDAAAWRSALAELLDGKESEGMLLPDTYTYSKPVLPRQLLGHMLEAQRSLLEQIGAEGMDARVLRTIASIVEKETSLDAERPMVSAVIRNRLQRGMRLQMDPTVIYGLWREDGHFSGNLRKVDLARDTPWNTYTRPGLPATPIGNPGRTSLLAAAQPADVDYLYFVANGEGGHVFASDFEQHRENVRRWLLIERQSGGGRQP